MAKNSSRAGGADGQVPGRASRPQSGKLSIGPSKSARGGNVAVKSGASGKALPINKQR